MIHVTHPRQIAIVGGGRLGSALARRLTETGHRLAGPLARDYVGAELSGAGMVLLCVPDREISAAAGVLAECLPEGDRCPLVGHCSGASTLASLDPLPPAARFSLHPLMTFAGAGEPRWDGTSAAVAAGSEPALNATTELARALGLVPFALDEGDRGAYHAAACMASNFLITLELAAERLASSAGVSREALMPLVRATVENWARDGADALTGPIARGDTETVTRQRVAVAAHAPELLRLFDALTDCTRELAAQATPEVAAQATRAPADRGLRAQAVAA